MIKLSVIIPVYNVEFYIKTCLSSLYEQALLDTEFEIILINDGSTDQSIPTIMPFLTQHSNLKIIEQSNQGVSIARNKGIQEASGEYILFMDADDVLSPNSLAQLLSEATKFGLDILRGDYQYIDEKGVIKNKKQHINVSLANKILDSTTFYCQICNHEFFSWLLLIKRKFLEKTKVKFNSKMNFLEDVLFTTELMLHHPQTMYVPIIFYKYRQHQTSAVVTLNESKLISIIELISTLKTLQQDNGISSRLNNKIQYYSNYFLHFLLISLSTPGIYEKRKAIIEILPKINPPSSYKNWHLYLSCKTFSCCNYFAVTLLYLLRKFKRLINK